MNVLVTGGAGFIGSHVASQALKDGHSVTVLDNLSSGKRTNVPEGADFQIGDIVNCDWDRYLKDIDVVVHCAAFVSAPESFDKFNLCCDTNVRATWNLISAGVHRGIRKLIFCSSSAVYAESTKPNYEEEYPGPTNPYGMTKLDVEFLLDMARREHGLGYTALRYFNVYGPRQDVNSDYSAVIPIFIKRAIQNVDLTVYGTGEQRRDFVYVEDVARAVMTFAVNDIAGVFNVGTGKDYSLLELADIILKKTGSKSKLKFEEVRPGDVNFSTASLGKQMKTKVWMPRVSFEDGIGRTIEFYRANPEF